MISIILSYRSAVSSVANLVSDEHSCGNSRRNHAERRILRRAPPQNELLCVSSCRPTLVPARRDVGESQAAGMNRRRIILGFAVSAFFLFFALRGQDYGAIREAFSQVTYWYLIPALGLYIIGLLVRAYRWSVLLRPVEKVSPRTLVGINAVGLMANNVLPPNG